MEPLNCGSLRDLVFRYNLQHMRKFIILHPSPNTILTVSLIGPNQVTKARAEIDCPCPRSAVKHKLYLATCSAVPISEILEHLVAHSGGLYKCWIECNHCSQLISTAHLFPNIQEMPNTNQHPSLGPSLGHVCYQGLNLRTAAQLTFQTLNLPMFSTQTPQKDLGFDSRLTYLHHPTSLDLATVTNTQLWLLEVRSRWGRMMKQEEGTNIRFSPCYVPGSMPSPYTCYLFSFYS